MRHANGNGSSELFLECHKSLYFLKVQLKLFKWVQTECNLYTVQSLHKFKYNFVYN